ncbi:FAD-dependent oxidoreductase [Pedobacter frigidisoli]|uniref:FAD-dependent oxidoreductase n=2 Tax=Pedobacter frigidisoli TaxID=2530455 RepID=A0A4R0P345_9SPHI|nr:FAD-dependent oxidoreductase [Pedobacter frigidisoli]
MISKRNYGSSLKFIILAIAIFSVGLDAAAQAIVKTQKADVIIYGGTAAAITAAVQVTKMGRSVIVVSPDNHLGGLSSSGLGFTDTGNKSVIGGLAREFYHRVYLHYQQDSAWKWQRKSEYGNKGQGTPAIDGKDRTMWIFEPHVAEKVMEDFVKENHIRVFRNSWLNRASGVKMKAGKITEISMLNGEKFQGKVFIDATYEGDLMAAAGITYHVGREPNSRYGETWNGVQAMVFQHEHHFAKAIDPYKIPGNPNSGFLPEINSTPIGINGAEDKKLQAYCFRMCLTNKTENRIAFPKPDRYNPQDYELLIRVFDSGWRALFNKYDPLPNHKTDTNNHGPFSTDFIGMNYDYPEAVYEKRNKIIKAHADYQKGLMYFMCTDQRVPKDLQQKLNTWGLAKDEFKDNENWPYQIYVREARRMISDYVMTENEVLGKRSVPFPIAMGSYALDSHNVQRYITTEGFVQNEGDIGVKAPAPYGISYGAIVPKQQQCTNLLVPVCLSASHIAYGSVRMEPVFMILGESAATAAVLAIAKKTSVQEVDYKELKALLLKQKQLLRFGVPN